MSDEENEFTVSPLKESAIQLHELYSELRHAGFTRGEALQIVCHTITAGGKE